MMMVNLRAAITQVARGGRSVLSRRSFSSSGTNAEPIVTEYIGFSASLKLTGFCASFGFVYLAYVDKVYDMFIEHFYEKADDRAEMLKGLDKRLGRIS